MLVGREMVTSPCPIADKGVRNERGKRSGGTYNGQSREMQFLGDEINLSIGISN